MNPASTTPARILLVDDSVAWRRVLSSIVQKQVGWEFVTEACDGLEAVEMASGNVPDLILLDLNLPRMNGIAACLKIRDRLPGTKILFVSQQIDSDLVHRAFEAGACGYAQKALVHRELVKAIEAVLQDKQFF